MKRRTNQFVSAAAAASLAFTPALLQSEEDEGLSIESKEYPYLKADGSWISLSGTVVAVAPDAFELKYHSGQVTVEMDDGDFDFDGYKLVEGDEVTVYGAIDDDLFETTSIEASSVYVKNANTYYYASPVDEEGATEGLFFSPADYDVAIRGEVTAIINDEFTVDTGLTTMTVSTSELGYNPLDDEGYQKIEVGDRVSVTGDIDVEWWKSEDLIAESVITLRDASSS